MSSQVRRGSGSEACEFELSVDDVVLLALLNMFKQTCTPSPKMKNRHLYKQVCRLHQRTSIMLGPRKTHPIPKQGPRYQNLYEPCWKSAAAFRIISILLHWRRKNKNPRQEDLYTNWALKSFNNVQRQTEMRGKDDAAWFSWSHYHYHSGNITPVRLNTPPQLSVSAISFSFSLLVLDLKCVYTDNSFIHFIRLYFLFLLMFENKRKLCRKEHRIERNWSEKQAKLSHLTTDVNIRTYCVEPYETETSTVVIMGAWNEAQIIL